MTKLLMINGELENTIKKHKLELISPSFVYLEITDPTYLNIKLGSAVYKGQTIGVDQIKKIPIISTVSGILKEVVIKKIHQIDHVYAVIENDFLEKYEKRIGYKKRIDGYSKAEFIDLLYNNRVVGQGGAGFPTYLKYQTKMPINHLIVNAIECEPGVTTDYETMLNHTENILDAISAILTINEIEKATIAINSEYVKVIDLFLQYLGSYPEITLLPMKVGYPLGSSRILVKEITGFQYNLYEDEVGIIVNNVSTIYNIYKVLKYRRPVTEKIITVHGDIKKPQNILIKIGAPGSEILNHFKISDNQVFITGGPLIGDKHLTSDFVIGQTTIGVRISNPTNYVVEKCINCGHCVYNCPMKINVVTARKNLAANKTHNLARCGVKRCIECGICSYVCPSRIYLKEIIIRSKEVVKNE